MSERPKYFQIHLSTVVVLVVVSGALAWANLTPRRLYLEYTPDRSTSMDGVHGWPFSVVAFETVEYIKKNSPGEEALALNRDYYPRFLAIAVNLFTALTIGGLTWYVCELVSLKFTGTAMFITTAGLIGANMIAREHWTYTALWHVYGWPLDAVAAIVLDSGKLYNFRFRYVRFSVNIVVAIGILFTVWLFCRWLIRRRAMSVGASNRSLTRDL